MEPVTGRLPHAEREERIAMLTAGGGRFVLVCTECLSEGINLQEHFDAVLHYDLAWNPTRHEQREGRVGRFGQEKSEVRVVTWYGADNPTRISPRSSPAINHARRSRPVWARPAPVNKPMIHANALDARDPEGQAAGTARRISGNNGTTRAPID